MVIRNKTARRLCVRIPNWVAKPQVVCRIDSDPVTNHWLNGYLVFHDLRPGARITIEFPMVQRTIRRTLGITGRTYTIQLRSNTVVDISPRDESAEPRIKDGALVLSRPVHLTVAGVSEKDVRVSVETDHSEMCGILLHYQNHWDYLVAWYTPVHQTILIERMAAGNAVRVSEGARYGTDARDLGPQLTLTAQIGSGRVQFAITDGDKTYVTSGPIEESRQKAGGVGLYVSQHTNAEVRYRNYRVSDADGRTIFEDRFDAGLDRWQGANKACDYLFYQREQMRRDEVSMVNKTRFAPHRVIEA